MVLHQSLIVRSSRVGTGSVLSIRPSFFSQSLIMHLCEINNITIRPLHISYISLYNEAPIFDTVIGDNHHGTNSINRGAYGRLFFLVFARETPLQTYGEDCRSRFNANETGASWSARSSPGCSVGWTKAWTNTWTKTSFWTRRSRNVPRDMAVVTHGDRVPRHASVIWLAVGIAYNDRSLAWLPV